MMEHPNYDQFWKSRLILPHLTNVTPAVMAVGGWFDAEDLYGPLNIYQSIEKNSSDTGHFNVLVMGPGGYRFVDYLKVGIPLTLIVLLVAAAAVLAGCSDATDPVPDHENELTGTRWSSSGVEDGVDHELAGDPGPGRLAGEGLAGICQIHGMSWCEVDDASDYAAAADVVKSWPC